MNSKGHGATAEFMRRKFGGVFRLEHHEWSLTTSPIQILPADPERVYIQFYTIAGEYPFVTPGMFLSLGRGYFVQDTTPWRFTAEEDFILPAQRWIGHAASGTQTLYAVTIRREYETED